MRSALLASLFVLSLCCSGFAHAQELGESTRIHQVDHGLRLHAAVGYPAIMALGLGYKSPGGTEVLAQAGGAAAWAIVAGTVELSVAHDFVRRKWGALHGGLAASLLADRMFVIDCYEGESCEDLVQTFWLGSPRLGLRLRLDPRKRYGAIPYLDFSAGPQVGLCRGDCPAGELVVNAAVHVRGVLDFKRDPSR